MSPIRRGAWSYQGLVGEEYRHVEFGQVAAQAGHLYWKVAHVPETRRNSVICVPIFAPYRLTECLCPDGDQPWRSMCV